METNERNETAAEMERQEELAKQNKMGIMAIGPLILNMSVPIIFSMLMQALYNVVDSIFVARLSEDALAAVGLVFPVQNLMIAAAVGTSVGVNSLMSRRLGERNVASANRAAVNGLFLAAVSGILFAVAGLFGSGFYMTAFTGDIEGAHIHQMGVDYMVIVTVGSLGLFLQVMLERLLQATGRATLSMVVQMVGAVVNIILDPIMIFGLLGFPAMGVAGAALATVIGQLVGMLIGLGFNLTRNPDIHLSFKGFRPNPKTIKHIYQVGLPSIVMQSIGSVMTFAMNKIVVVFGTTALGVFNVYFKLQSFVFMPVMGLNNGLIPIIAFNYGARKPQRIQKAVRYGLAGALGIMVVGAAAFLLLPRQLMSLFDAGDAMMAIGVPALRIIALGFPLAAVSIIFNSVFQGVGQGMYSLWMSLIRQLIVLVPLAFLLARVSGLEAMWFSFPIAEVVCTLCATWFYLGVRKNKIQPLALGTGTGKS